MMRRALNSIKDVCGKRGLILCPGIAPGTGLHSQTLTTHFRSVETRNTLVNPTPLRYATKSEKPGSKRKRKLVRLRLQRLSPGAGLDGRGKISALASQVTEDLVPRALPIFNINQNATLVKEAIKLQLPIIAVLANKSDPFGIQFPIPGNSETPESLELYMSCVRDAVSDGERNEMKEILRIQ